MKLAGETEFSNGINNDFSETLLAAVKLATPGDRLVPQIYWPHRRRPTLREANLDFMPARK